MKNLLYAMALAIFFSGCTTVEVKPCVDLGHYPTYDYDSVNAHWAPVVETETKYLYLRRVIQSMDQDIKDLAPLVAKDDEYIYWISVAKVNFFHEKNKEGDLAIERANIVLHEMILLLTGQKT